MKDLKANKLLMAIATIVVGVLLITLKGAIVSLAVTIFGVYLIVVGVLDIVKRGQLVNGLVKIAVGVVAAVLSWLIVVIASVLLGVVLIINGVTSLLQVLKAKRPKGLLATLLVFAAPVISIIGGLCLCGAWGSLAVTMYTVAGIVVILNGVVSLVDFLATK